MTRTGTVERLIARACITHHEPDPVTPVADLEVKTLRIEFQRGPA